MRNALAFLLLISFPTFSGENSALLKLDPAIAEKPDVLARIKKLKANEGCLLPAPTILENLGNFAEGWHQMKQYGPGGRDYSIKMVWMPDRKRAFFCGANHGAPHRFNDAWEYDLAGNTWALLYTPDWNDTSSSGLSAKDILVIQDGFLRTQKGGPGHPAHTWWGITYDPNLKAVVWYASWPPGGLKPKLDLLGAKPEDLYQGPQMWLFYPETKKWEPMKTSGATPYAYNYGSQMEYIEDLKKPVLFCDKNRYTLDTKAKTWTSSNSPLGIPIETLLYYDTKRKLMVAHAGGWSNWAGHVTWTAPVDEKGVQAWSKALETEQNAPVGHDKDSMMYYDPRSAEGLLWDNSTRTIWSFNPDAKKWTKLEPTGEKVTEKHGGRMIAYFDPVYNVYVVIGSGWVWCYRYKE